MKSIFAILLFFAAQSQAQMEFVGIPAGRFVYGKFNPPYPTPDSKRKSYTHKDYQCAKKMAGHDARQGFEVKVDSFEIAKFEVTQQQWEMLMDTNPSFFKGNDLPVQNVSWLDATQFIMKLNEADSNHFYRLPTEFEWEYAARAGNMGDISWDNIREQAHISTDSPARVGSKKPNAFGLYDMLGNVWEWVDDIYNEKMFADKVSPAKGSQHVLKGASFVGDVKNATYMTHAGGPGNGWDVGFRVARVSRANSNRQSSALEVSNNAGKSIDPDGWHVSRTSHQGTTPLVDIKNGVITLSQHPYGQGGVLLTNKKYRDFEITVDVKIDSFCNSGIFLRATESGQAYQVELSEPGGTGNLFGEMLRISKPGEADKSRVWKPGDWNTFRIRMTGASPRVLLWINGEQMYDVVQPKNDFTAGAVEGYIGLQAHWSATYSDAAKAFDMSESWKPGGKVRFRNVRIKEL